MTEVGTGARALELLEAVRPLGCEAVVCYSAGRHFLTEADPVWWLTRFKPLGETVATVAPDGTVAIHVTPSWDLSRAQAAAGDVSLDARPLEEALVRFASDNALEGPAVACWGSAKLVARRAAGLVNSLGETLPADGACEQVSRRRTPADVAVLEELAMLAAAGFDELRRIARPGMAEFELAARLEGHLRRLGAGDTFLLMSSSRHNLALHPPTERVLAKGDVLLVELSPSRQAMYTQICRTAVVGEAPPRLTEDFEVLSASLAEGATSCRPGVPVADVVATMDAVLEEAGYGEFCKPPYMRARGHGLGLASSLPGDLTHDSSEALVEGDYFVLHPNQYLPSSGYLLCGEPLLVTRDGGRPLTGSFAPLAELA